MKERKFSILAGLLFCIGLLVFFEPIISNQIYMWKYAELICQYQSHSTKDYTSLWEAAVAYNEALVKKENQFRVSDTEKAYVETLLNPLGNGMMGYIDIPTIQVHLPIYQGTTEDSLQSGVGWWIGTSLPTGGKATHCVLTAHTGLAKAKMFSDIDKLAIGDTFSLKILDQTLLYEVDQIKIVLPEEIEDLRIAPDSDYVTLYTCTPYGINTHRLLVRGHRIFPTDQIFLLTPQETINNALR